MDTYPTSDLSPVVPSSELYELQRHLDGQRPRALAPLVSSPPQNVAIPPGAYQLTSSITSNLQSTHSRLPSSNSFQYEEDVSEPEEEDEPDSDSSDDKYGDSDAVVTMIESILDTHHTSSPSISLGLGANSGQESPHRSPIGSPSIPRRSRIGSLSAESQQLPHPSPEPLQSRPHVQRSSHTQRRRRRTKAEKFKVIQRALRKMRISLRTVVEHYMHTDDRRHYWKRRQKLLGNVEDPSEGVAWVVPKLQAELDALVGTKHFGTYYEGTDRPLQEPDFSGILETIEQHAPTWAAILNSMLSPRRSKWPSYNRGSGTEQKREQKSMTGRMFMVMSILCHTRARKTSNWLSKYLGIYLIMSGAKRRVINTLYGFGLTTGYTDLLQATHTFSEIQKVGVQPAVP